MSFLKMCVPADGVKGIKQFVLESIVGAGGKPCPPGIVGVGIGGSADYAMYLAKEAIARPVGTRNADPHVAKLEEELYELLNETGIGRSEEHTSELQSQSNLACRLLLEKKNSESNAPSRTAPAALNSCSRRHRWPRLHGSQRPPIAHPSRTSAPWRRKPHAAPPVHESRF